MHVSSTFSLFVLAFGFLVSPASVADGTPVQRHHRALARPRAVSGLRSPASAVTFMSQGEAMLMDSKEVSALNQRRHEPNPLPRLVSVCRSTLWAGYDLDAQPRGYEGCLSASPEGVASSRAGAALLLPLGHY